MTGTLLVPVESLCLFGGCGGYPPRDWLAKITGFATTFDVLQTFTPTASQLSFRVPYMPEGFQSADWFNTYYGDLSTVGDWSQAQPLQCNYPGPIPTTGDGAWISGYRR